PSRLRRVTPQALVKAALSQWQLMNHGRHVLTLAGWLAALEAFSLLVRPYGIAGVASSRRLMQMLKGGCFCGWIRYETEATPFDETNCHCSICRRTTGAPFVAWFSVPRSQFRLVCGEPTRFRSTTK